MSETATAPTEASRPKRSRDGTRQTWAERLARFALSGLTPAQFCASEGVSLPSFYSWKRRLTSPPLPADAEHVPGATREPRLLPVRLTAAAVAVEVVLPHGTVLRIPPGCDLAFVRSLVKTLGGQPC
jgi:transposase